MVAFSRRAVDAESAADRNVVDLLLSLFPPPSASSSAGPCSPLSLLHVLMSYRAMYEDECQLKQNCIAGLLSSIQASLSTAQSSSPQQQSQHANLQLLWRAQAGLDQERLEEIGRLLQSDAEWRRQQRQKGHTANHSTPSRTPAQGSSAHSPASADASLLLTEQLAGEPSSEKAKTRRKKKR